MEDLLKFNYSNNQNMIIGIPKEVKNNENRVALTPKGVATLIKRGHKVEVEKSAGVGSGFSDTDYKKAGAKIVDTKTAWSADLVIKVKDPIEKEYKYFRKDQILFTFLHLAGTSKSLTQTLIKSKCVAIAYETIENEGILPLLKPMSEIAGKLAVQEGAKFLLKTYGNLGVLIDKISNVEPGKVVIIGGGSAGTASAIVATGRGANVTLLDINKKRLAQLKKKMPSKNFHAVLSSRKTIEREVKNADLLIGAVLIPGKKALFVVTEKMVKSMKKGAVIVDIAIDQGGCIATSHPTTHQDPIFIKHDVIHYCVTNMPGIVPRTSTMALTSVTLPYIIKIASQGVEKIAKHDKHFAKGINVYKGHLTSEPVSEALNIKYENLEKVILEKQYA